MSETTESAALTGALDGDATLQPALEQEQLQTPQNPVEDDAETAEPEPIEEVEFNFGGNKLKLPKGASAEEAYAAVNEYTAKVQTEFQRGQEAVTQRVAQLAESAKLIDAMSNLDGRASALLARSQRLDEEYQQLVRIDRDALWQSNPDDARRVSDRLSQVQAEYQQAVGGLRDHQSQRQTAHAEYTAHETARIETAGREHIAKHIPNFSAKIEAELVEFAMKDGVSPEDAKAWARNPIATRWAYDAMKYRQMQERATKAASPTPPPATPSAPIRPRAAPAAKNPETMSMDDYVRFRNTQTQPGRR